MSLTINLANGRGAITALTLLAAVLAAYRSAAAPPSIATIVPTPIDELGRAIACSGDRGYVADQVLVSVRGDRANDFTSHVLSQGLTVIERREAPTNVTWMTLRVDTGSVLQRVAGLAQRDGVIQAMPNYVLDSGEVLVNGGGCP
ncbi:MAG TPA: hypothetical protein VFH62_00950 [Dehalococcoidia bacterium]|nr:hypothetical protein [Dehalococcoidia bacterium]